MSLLALQTITSAQTQVGPVLQYRTLPRAVAVLANFVAGGGGTSVTAFVQTTLDSGLSWIDCVALGFTTASGRAVANLSALTPNSVLVPTDATLASGTVRDGIVGPSWRVKTVSTGTYSAGTTLSVYLVGLTT